MPQQLPLDELTLALARIRGLLLTEEKVDRAVQRLAEGIREAFPESSGAGASLMDESGRRTSTGATDPLVLKADSAQYELGEGPCITAWATERSVVIQDVATDGRWPLWSQAVRELSIRSVISSPLMAGTRCLGALKIYSTRPGAYDDASARPLEKLAVPAATLLDNIQSSEAPQRFTEVLASALDSRDTINRAQGFLMHLHGLDQTTALQQLVELSKTSRQSLFSISTEILTGTKRAPDDGP
ncbi:ANTAR domain protein [Pseudarthrobacter siccitolerans]|uniref:ANTAR domain protein n=1 Tax=Pseudarthrobacter siccitolerans TaxID=861266 RepID=A0A024GXD3_9MICC|nr:GAF and ANTAR domain-containing protein [Pseudarthrobacter siccitolerans]CCQ44605.1 ANTAR domain protein [Pseudarthrobacter siccitolerans]